MSVKVNRGGLEGRYGVKNTFRPFHCHKVRRKERTGNLVAFGRSTSYDRLKGDTLDSLALESQVYLVRSCMNLQGSDVESTSAALYLYRSCIASVLCHIGEICKCGKIAAENRIDIILVSSERHLYCTGDILYCQILRIGVELERNVHGTVFYLTHPVEQHNYNCNSETEKLCGPVPGDNFEKSSGCHSSSSPLSLWVSPSTTRLFSVLKSSSCLRS